MKNRAIRKGVKDLVKRIASIHPVDQNRVGIHSEIRRGRADQVPETRKLEIAFN